MSDMLRARAKQDRTGMPAERSRAAWHDCAKEQLRSDAPRRAVPPADLSRRLPEGQALGLVVILSVAVWALVWGLVYLTQLLLA
jgi:ferric-dicitrate binding protein FerR (iron transport regulator)